MEARAGRWAREESRRLHLDFFLENWWRLLALLAASAAGLSLMATFSHGFDAGLAFGATLASLGWVSVYLAVVVKNTAGKLMGSEAEQ